MPSYYNWSQAQTVPFRTPLTCSLNKSSLVKETWFFHTEWENKNKFITNILGPSIVNSTAGIMIQEIKPGFEIDQHVRKLPVLQRSRTVLSNAVPETLPL